MMHAPDHPSENIKAAMKTLGLNQPRFAEEIGVDQGTVSKWINGKANPSGPVLKLIERMLADHERGQAA